ncbi:MAG TPA: heme exporter protein CcmB, partial [Acidimicrobiales bacterium]|nr:heme exporter protein CcmB [Acidimicrobiales bacterium]
GVSSLRLAMAVAAKDLRIELHGRHAAGLALPFVGTLLLAFGLALGPGRALLEATAPGLLWLALLFASTLLARRAYEAEAEDGALEGLVLAPVDKASVFAAKAAAMAVELPVLEASVLIMVAVLFELPHGYCRDSGSRDRLRKPSFERRRLTRVGADEDPPVASLTERPVAQRPRPQPERHPERPRPDLRVRAEVEPGVPLVRAPALLREPREGRFGDRFAIEVEGSEHLPQEDVDEHRILAARPDDQAEVGGVRSDAGELHQRRSRLASRHSPKPLEVDSADDGLGDPLDAAVSVPDPAGANRVQWRDGELRRRRRRVVNALRCAKWLSERSGQVGPHRVQASEGRVLGADHVDHGVEHREGALPLGSEVVLDARGEHGVVRNRGVEGPQVVFEAQPPNHYPAGLLDVRPGEDVARGQRQLELRRLVGAQGTDVDLDRVFPGASPAVHGGVSPVGQECAAGGCTA